MEIGITCYPTYGGSGAGATELGLHLADRGHEVQLISNAQPFRLKQFHERIFFPRPLLPAAGLRNGSLSR